jgi:hypothetical protein
MIGSAPGPAVNRKATCCSSKIAAPWGTPRRRLSRRTSPPIAPQSVEIQIEVDRVRSGRAEDRQRDAGPEAVNGTVLVGRSTGRYLHTREHAGELGPQQSFAVALAAERRTRCRRSSRPEGQPARAGVTVLFKNALVRSGGMALMTTTGVEVEPVGEDWRRQPLRPLIDDHLNSSPLEMASWNPDVLDGGQTDAHAAAGTVQPHRRDGGYRWLGVFGAEFDLAAAQAVAIDEPVHAGPVAHLAARSANVRCSPGRGMRGSAGTGCSRRHGVRGHPPAGCGTGPTPARTPATSLTW